MPTRQTRYQHALVLQHHHQVHQVLKIQNGRDELAEAEIQRSPHRIYGWPQLWESFLPLLQQVPGCRSKFSSTNNNQRGRIFSRTRTIYKSYIHIVGPHVGGKQTHSLRQEECGSRGDLDQTISLARASI
jgi:hypothetical protein